MTDRPSKFTCGRFTLPMGSKTYIMGVLNVTPNSFYDGGRYTDVEKAVIRVREMVEEGADIIDVGGQSLRPGHTLISAEEEIDRVIPVVEKLVKEFSVPISVDTCKSAVAQKALQAGAHIINDVWGLQKDERIAQLVSQHNAGIVMMHNQENFEYKDLMGDIINFFKRSINIAQNAGISRDRMIIDPGIGYTFGKKQEQDFEIMRRLRELSALNLPVLLGTSMKSFMGNFLGIPVEERLEATVATVAVGINYGVDMVRVHNIRPISHAVKITDEIVRTKQYG